jgi:hypothetical protein
MGVWRRLLLIVLEIYVILFEEWRVLATQPVLIVIIILTALLTTSPQEIWNQMTLIHTESSISATDFAMTNCYLNEIIAVNGEENLVNIQFANLQWQQELGELQQECHQQCRHYECQMKTLPLAAYPSTPPS